MNKKFHNLYKQITYKYKFVKHYSHIIYYWLIIEVEFNDL